MTGLTLRLADELDWNAQEALERSMAMAERIVGAVVDGLHALAPENAAAVIGQKDREVKELRRQLAAEWAVREAVETRHWRFQQQVLKVAVVDAADLIARPNHVQPDAEEEESSDDNVESGEEKASEPEEEVAETEPGPSGVPRADNGQMEMDE